MRQAVRHPLGWLLAFALLHGLLYAVLTHPWQAPDEYLHYEYLRLIDLKRSLDLSADDRSSAVQWEVAESQRLFQHNRFRLLPTLPEAEFRAIPTPLGSKVFTPQPPLYYLLSLPIYWALRTRSVLSQLYALRVFSVALHVLTVGLSYLLARQVFRGSRSRARSLAVAAWVALWPAYTFISASYNNDNLAAPLVAGSLFALVIGLRRKGELRLWMAAAVLAALAALTKRTTWALLPVLVLALIPYGVVNLRSGTRRGKVVGSVLLALGLSGVAAFVVPVAIPFQLPPDVARMLRLSPDALMKLSARLAELRTVDWQWWFTFMLDSFSAQFGWVFDWLPRSLAFAMRLLYLAIAAGGVIAVVRALRTRERGAAGVMLSGAGLLAAGVAVALLFMAAQYIAQPTYYPPQGRYLFPFISAIGVIAVIGWEAFWPERLRLVGLAAGLALVAAFDLYCWAVLVIPYYYL